VAEVQVSVAGRSYRLACRDGDEPALKDAARELDARAEALVRALGTETEARLLLMTALQLVGELRDTVRSGNAPSANQPPDLAGLATAAEALAERLERAAGLAPVHAAP
jgi:cell division protein ZapA